MGARTCRTDKIPVSNSIILDTKLDLTMSNLLSDDHSRVLTHEINTIPLQRKRYANRNCRSGATEDANPASVQLTQNWAIDVCDDKPSIHRRYQLNHCRVG